MPLNFHPISLKTTQTVLPLTFTNGPRASAEEIFFQLFLFLFDY